MRYMLCYFNCNEYLVSDIWDVSLYNDQFREIKVDEYFFFRRTNILMPYFSFRGFFGKKFKQYVFISFEVLFFNA